jgi:putative tryptophan/tyrosine transport system substrate-binding protein
MLAREGVADADAATRPGDNLSGDRVGQACAASRLFPSSRQCLLGESRTVKERDDECAASCRAQLARSFKAAATSLAVEPIVAHIHGMADIERVIQTMVRTQNGGIIFPPDVTLIPLREQIVATVARGRLPAIYSDTTLATSGGLAAYSADRVDLFRKAASYVDRILRGEKPGDLPIQEPTKYEFVINLKTAKALGLEISPLVVALADKVIE